jgi:hypothetical protein
MSRVRWNGSVWRRAIPFRVRPWLPAPAMDVVQGVWLMMNGCASDARGQDVPVDGEGVVAVIV